MHTGVEKCTSKLVNPLHSHSFVRFDLCRTKCLGWSDLTVKCFHRLRPHQGDHNTHNNNTRIKTRKRIDLRSQVYLTPEPTQKGKPRGNNTLQASGKHFFFLQIRLLQNLQKISSWSHVTACLAQTPSKTMTNVTKIVHNQRASLTRYQKCVKTVTNVTRVVQHQQHLKHNGNEHTLKYVTHAWLNKRV